MHGSEWSMATSSIHFIDLISYLVEKEYEILNQFGKVSYHHIQLLQVPDKVNLSNLWDD